VKSQAEFERCGKETERFVASYLTLRAAEQKILKESEVAFSSQNLAHSVAKAMAGKAIATSSTDRYTGGAKERAEAKLKEGSATRDDLAVLKGDNCSWCAGILSAASRQAKAVYCSQECAEDGRLRRGGMYASSRIRAQVFALEGGVCQLCGVDAHAFFLRVKSLPPSQRLSVLCNANWRLPRTNVALQRLLQDPTEGNFWQADHIKAVSEGGGGCGIENLRTLCVPCHTSETETLRGRLKRSGGVNGSSQQKPNGSGIRKSKQTDIRSVFASLHQNCLGLT
jgi:HNH endonuclease